MNKLFTPRAFFVISAILIAAFSRFIPHPYNFTAVGAIALFAGATMSNRWLSLIIPMAAMFLTDLFFTFHNTMWATYSAMALTSMIGWAIRDRQNFITIAMGSLVSALLFFFITNAAMWVVGFFIPDGFYTRDFAGLVNSIVQGIPYMSNTIISQLIYTGILFGAFHTVRVWKPTLVRV
jgi:hypothetical protein